MWKLCLLQALTVKAYKETMGAQQKMVAVVEGTALMDSVVDVASRGSRKVMSRKKPQP